MEIIAIGKPQTATRQKRTFYGLKAAKVCPFLFDFRIKTWSREKPLYLGSMPEVSGKLLGAIELIDPSKLGYSFDGADLAIIPASALFVACDHTGKQLFCEPLINLVRSTASNKLFMLETAIDTNKSYLYFSGSSSPGGNLFFQFYLR